MSTTNTKKDEAEGESFVLPEPPLIPPGIYRLKFSYPIDGVRSAHAEIVSGDFAGMTVELTVTTAACSDWWRVVPGPDAFVALVNRSNALGGVYLRLVKIEGHPGYQAGTADAFMGVDRVNIPISVYKRDHAEMMQQWLASRGEAVDVKQVLLDAVKKAKPTGAA